MNVQAMTGLYVCSATVHNYVVCSQPLRIGVKHNALRVSIKRDQCFHNVPSHALSDIHNVLSLGGGGDEGGGKGGGKSGRGGNSNGASSLPFHHKKTVRICNLCQRRFISIATR